MKITLDYTISLQENASNYFQKAKIAKKKIEGATKAIEIAKKKIEKEEKLQEIAKKKIVRQKQWFEKFRWFYTTNGFLAIGGRDATTNEVVVKKYMEPTDIVFHTEMSGSPFFLLKTTSVEGKKPQQVDIDDVAQITAVYSKAWQHGFSSVAVFSVTPEQVSKEANSGEYMSKGSFMIRGEKTFYHPPLELFMTLKENIIYVGTKQSLPKGSLRLFQGQKKSSEIAKLISKKLKHDDIDEIVRMLPTGGIQLSS